MPRTLDEETHSGEPAFVRQIRKNKEEIAEHLGELIDQGHAFEDIALWVTDGSDRIGKEFLRQQPGSRIPLIAALPRVDLAMIADEASHGLGAFFRRPAPEGAVHVLVCDAGRAHRVALQCLPANVPEA